jgi:hypothetical protein
VEKRRTEANDFIDGRRSSDLSVRFQGNVAAVTVSDDYYFSFRILGAKFGSLTDERLARTCSITVRIPTTPPERVGFSRRHSRR